MVRGSVHNTQRVHDTFYATKEQGEKGDFCRESHALLFPFPLPSRSPTGALCRCHNPRVGEVKGGFSAFE